MCYGTNSIDRPMLQSVVQLSTCDKVKHFSIVNCTLDFKKLQIGTGKENDSFHKEKDFS